MPGSTKTIRAELHSHSTSSDGSYPPSEVAGLCAEAGVAVWALTDHDNCGGCAEAAAAAAKHGIEFIAGIEVSAFEERSIHVLGYGVDPESDAIIAYSRRRLRARRERMRAMIERLVKLGVPVTYESVVEVAGSGALGRPHLASALVEAGHVESHQEAFDRFLRRGGSAYVATEWPTVPDAIALIADAGGIAVLAHPGLYDLDDRIDAWSEAGLTGIEVSHPKHDAADERRYLEAAERLDLIPTASSDFHGPHHVGHERFGKVELPRAWAEPLFERLQISTGIW